MHLPPAFSHSAESLLNEAKQLVDNARHVHNTIVAQVTPETATSTNTLLPFVHEENQRLHGKQLLEFYASVSTDQEIRDASNEAQKLFSDFHSEALTRKDLYLLFTAVKNGNEILEPELQRLLDHRLFYCERNGVHLPDNDRARLVEINKSLGEIGREFQRNLVKSTEELWLTREELAGLPEDKISEFVTDEEKHPGKFRVALEPLQYGTILRFGSNSNTRKLVTIAYSNKCKENVSLLQNAIVLRDEAARLLGYSNHAEFKVAACMEKSLARINSFLSELRVKLTPKRDAELEKLKAIKADDLVKRGEEADAKFFIWDSTYYGRILWQQVHQIDSELISEYFPVHITVDRMLEVFAHLFSMLFTRVAGKRWDELAEAVGSNALTWHEDVLFYEVWDLSDNSAFLGYLYMDLHPRDGKYGHAADLPVHPGFIDATTGKRSYPATALICNFTKPTKTKPSLLKHYEVWMLFHELGHGIHDLVSKTKYARFHGPEVVSPFSEAPSQMLENWCWTASTLRSLSQHYSTLTPEYMAVWRESSSFNGVDVPAQLPVELVENLVSTQQARTFQYSSSLAMSTFDMAIHQPESHEDAKLIDTTYLWNQIKHEVSGLEGPEGEGYHWSHGQATFGHEFQGYDAGYYGYLASQVYASDMFDSVFRSNPMDAGQGLRYRREVLEPGGTEEPLEMLTRFLGRPPHADAFYRELGLA